NPERHARVTKAGLTSRWTIESDSTAFRKEIFSQPAIRVRLRLIGAKDGEWLLSIGRMEWQQETRAQPGLGRGEAQALEFAHARGSADRAVCSFDNQGLSDA